MKRLVIFLLFCVILALFSFVPVFAQQQEGNATWYRSTSTNLQASHARFPLGTKLKVTCLENNKVVYVTVSNRIPNDTARILDISQSAAEVLGITGHERAAVKIEVVREIPADEAPVTSPVKVVEAGTPSIVEPVYEDIPEISAVPAQPAPAQPAPQPAPQAPARTSIPSADANNQPAVQPPADPGSQVSIKVNVNINGKEYVFEVSPPSASNRSAVTATPALPPAAGRKVYRVQVGSFSNPAFAQEYFNKLKNAGFSPSIERYDSLYRVVISGVNYAEIPLVVERLGIAGFNGAWIREEK